MDAVSNGNVLHDITFLRSEKGLLFGTVHLYIQGILYLEFDLTMLALLSSYMSAGESFSLFYGNCISVIIFLLIFVPCGALSKLTSDSVWRKQDRIFLKISL